MTIAAFPDPFGTLVAARGKVAPSAMGCSIGVFRLATDPVGYATATFSGVHAGSEIRVFKTSTGVESGGVESCDADHVLVFPVFGAPDNVTIRIVSMPYKTQEFALNVSKGVFSIPIQQYPDPWYSNPA